MYMFCLTPTANSDGFPKHKLLTDFYEANGLCLLRGWNGNLVYYLDKFYVSKET